MTELTGAAEILARRIDEHRAIDRGRTSISVNREDHERMKRLQKRLGEGWSVAGVSALAFEVLEAALDEMGAK